MNLLLADSHAIQAEAFHVSGSQGLRAVPSGLQWLLVRVIG